MSEKVKETIVDEAHRVKALSQDAVRSGAYLYPLRGIVYFVTHRDLWQPLWSKLTPTLTLGVGVTTAMFLFTYLPQLAVLAFTSGPLAVISTTLLVLSESSTIVTVLSKTLLIEDALIDTFDGTLVSKNMTNVVSEGRQIKSGNNSMAKLGKLAKKPFAKFTPKALIRYLMYLPLNFIPVVGSVLFVILQGKRAGPSAHSRYFQLKQWSETRKDEFVHQHQAAYTSFGVASVLLELVPVASIFFAFTNTVGAALWAADLERGETTAPNLKEQVRKAE
ncbi:MAG: hypothetical protein M1835_007725 [Candelina submexicana]|nr:MAG: hypothetical protein M1835_007725 [Candelina submexicana]